MDTRLLDRRMCRTELFAANASGLGWRPTRELVLLNVGLLGLTVSMGSHKPHDLGQRTEGTEAWRLPRERVSEPSQASGLPAVLCFFYQCKLGRSLPLPGLCERGPRMPELQETPHVIGRFLILP